MPGRALDMQADLLAAHAGIADPSQGRLADERRVNGQIHQAIQAQFVGVGPAVHVGVVGEHGAFDPPNRRRVPRFETQGFTHGHDPFPQLVAA